MRKLLAFFSFLVIAASSHAQTAILPIYACTQAGVHAKVSGMNSTNYMEGIIPSCSVTVYLTGTHTIATTTPQSPFTGNIDGSIPPISAPTGQAYDVVFSGGTPPNTYPSPVTLTGVGSGGGGGGGGSVMVTGTPTSGNMTAFSGASSITNGNLSGDVTTSGSLLSTVKGIYGYPVAATAPVQSAVLIYDTSFSLYNIRTLTADDIAPGFSITSFNCSLCGTVEIGATITNPAFTVSYSATPTSAAITNTAGISSPTTLTTPFTGATVTGAFTLSTQGSITFTLTAVGASTKATTKAIVVNPRSFGGVGAAGATSSVTASGTTAVLSTGAILTSAGLLSTPVNVSAAFGTYSPSLQKIYILCTGGSRTFKDSVTGFSFAFNAPTAVSFVNANGVTVTMYLYESTNLLSGPYSILVVS